MQHLSLSIFPDADDCGAEEHVFLDTPDAAAALASECAARDLKIVFLHWIGATLVADAAVSMA